MFKHTKNLLIFSFIILSLMLIRIYQEYNSYQNIKLMIFQDEAKSLGDVIKSIRKVYQNTFLEYNIPIDPKTINLLPICSMNKISNQFAQFTNDKAQIRVASNNPRNPNNMATTKELKLIESYKISKSLNPQFELENYSMIASIPIYVEQGCLKCHGEKAQTLDFVKTSYSDGFDYKLGDLRGILAIEVSKEEIISKLDLEFYINIAINFLMFMFFVIAAYLLLQKVQKTEQNYSKLLESKISEQVELIQNKDKVLFQQSKMAAMGEMIANIAHQWRQPLSVISTIASNIKVQKELNNLDENLLTNNMNEIVVQTQYLSKTIDDFREFIEDNKEKELFNLHKALTDTISILNASFKNNYIQIFYSNEAEDFIFDGYKNQFEQSLINILNNAKDALVEKMPSDERFIFIDANKIGDNLVIKISDNAQGIKEDIIERIFEPYFTTKHKSKGTGLGLYMTYDIVVKHLSASLSVQNIHFKHNDKDYTGAEFKIIL